MDRIDRLLSRAKGSNFLLIVNFLDGTYKVGEAGGKLQFTKIAPRETPCTIDCEAGECTDLDFSTLFKCIIYPKDKWNEVMGGTYPYPIETMV